MERSLEEYTQAYRRVSRHYKSIVGRSPEVKKLLREAESWIVEHPDEVRDSYLNQSYPISLEPCRRDKSRLMDDDFSLFAKDLDNLLKLESYQKLPVAQDYSRRLSKVKSHLESDCLIISLYMWLKALHTNIKRDQSSQK